MISWRKKMDNNTENVERTVSFPLYPAILQASIVQHKEEFS
jgi:hypothetical protein